MAKNDDPQAGRDPAPEKTPQPTPEQGTPYTGEPSPSARRQVAGKLFLRAADVNVCFTLCTPGQCNCICECSSICNCNCDCVCSQCSVGDCAISIEAEVAIGVRLVAIVNSLVAVESRIQARLGDIEAILQSISAKLDQAGE